MSAERIEQLKQQMEKMAAMGDQEAVQLLKDVVHQLQANEDRLTRLTSTTSVKMEAALHIALKTYGSQHSIRLQQIYEDAIQGLWEKREKWHAKHQKLVKSGKSPKPNDRFVYEATPNVGKNYTLNLSVEAMDVARSMAIKDERRLCDVLYTGLVHYAGETIGFVWDVNE